MMKALIFCIALIAIAQASNIVGTDEEIAMLNTVQNSWVAGKNQFSGMSAEGICAAKGGYISSDNKCHFCPDGLHRINLSDRCYGTAYLLETYSKACYAKYQYRTREEDSHQVCDYGVSGVPGKEILGVCYYGFSD